MTKGGRYLQSAMGKTCKLNTTRLKKKNILENENGNFC